MLRKMRNCKAVKGFGDGVGDDSRQARRAVVCFQSVAFPSRAVLTSVIVLVVIGFSVVDGQDCHHPSDVGEDAFTCQHRLEEVTFQALRGELSQENWSPSCINYNETVRCVKLKLKPCSREIQQLLSQGVMPKLVDGVGRFCESKETFSAYLKYSECYRGRGNITEQCLHEFNRDVHHGVLDDSSMCRTVSRLLNCTDIDYFSSNCGSEAAIIMQKLVRAQVPNDILRSCPSPTTTPPLSDSSASLVPVAYYWSTLLLLVSVAIGSVARLI